MKEQWTKIEGFPSYLVSDLGRVMNHDTEQIKVPSVNQQGIAHVNLSLEGTQNRRSVAILVANAFLPPPERNTFDTPIHLNGDRMDARACNLMWRPRWFARRYHLQFSEPPPYGYTGPIELLDKDECYRTVRDCAMTYGLLEKEIVVAAHNSQPVFPFWFYFRMPLDG